MQAVEAQVKEERKRAGEIGLLLAGRYLMLIQKYDKAKEYLDRAIKLNPTNPQVDELPGGYKPPPIPRARLKQSYALLGQTQALVSAHHFERTVNECGL